MRKLIPLFLCLFLHIDIHAQHPQVQKIVDDLANLNLEVVEAKCGSGKSMIVTNRGLNRFFADKIASYLSQSGDISLFKNYATLNSLGGEFSINHNFGNTNLSGHLQPLTSIGFKAKISEGFASVFAEQKLKNDLGFLFKRTWFGRGSTFFGQCMPGETEKPTPGRTQKSMMNAKRSFILHNLEMEMINRTKDFERVLEKMQTSEFEFPEQLEPARSELRESFFKNLRTEYERKFAEQEAKALAGDSSYNLIATHWTTIAVFIPVTTQNFTIAPSFAHNFSDEELYPWKIALSYSEILESSHSGRFILFFNAEIFKNNSVNTKGVSKLKVQEYQKLGGTDTLRLAELNTEEVYVGNYSSFITPLLKMQFVWFPKKSTAGLSFLLEKNFGKFHPLNARLGMPIRFNDKQGNATVNFELQLRASDINKALNTQKSFGKRLTVGFSVGLPFTSNIY